MTAEVSGSSLGRMRSSPSTSVIEVPSRANDWAISHPIGPSPSTIIVSGRRSRSKTSSLVSGDTSRRPGIAGTAGLAPVATTNRCARIVRPFTSMEVGELKRANPSITSICSVERAAASNALDGMQPVNVQSPPTGPSWTTTVLAPLRRASRAAMSPPAPPPITTRSYEVVTGTGSRSVLRRIPRRAFPPIGQFGSANRSGVVAQSSKKPVHRMEDLR